MSVWSWEIGPCQIVQASAKRWEGTWRAKVAEKKGVGTLQPELNLPKIGFGFLFSPASPCIVKKKKIIQGLGITWNAWGKRATKSSISDDILVKHDEYSCSGVWHPHGTGCRDSSGATSPRWERWKCAFPFVHDNVCPNSGDSHAKKGQKYLRVQASEGHREA